MKTIKKSFMFIFSLLVLVACEDEDKLNINFGAPNPAGNFVTAVITEAVINGDDIPNGSFNLTVDVPANNVSQFDMTVRRITPNNEATEFVHLLTVTEFPTDLIITTSQLADLFGITISDLNLGDTFEFLNSSISSVDGSVTTIASIDNDLASEVGAKQAYNLKTQIICPIPTDYAVGTYFLEVISTDSGFGTPWDDQEVQVEALIVGGVESVYQRVIKELYYLPQFDIGQPNMDFQFDYFCGNLNAAENQGTSLGCGGSILMQPSATPVPYSLSFDDDDVITINFIEGLDNGGCGADANVQIRLTKQ